MLKTAGTYTVTLTATDSTNSDSDTFSYTFTVNPDTTPPSADDVNPKTGESGATVQFTPTLSGTPPDTYSWDFGGGATPDTPTDPSPSVTLGAVGSYSASLTVTNANGSDTFDFTLEVTDPADAPDIQNVTPNTASQGTFVDLKLDMNPAAGTATSWLWEFDPDGDSSLALDGTLTSTEESPHIKVNEAGIYEVRVTATNASGSDTFGDHDSFFFFVTP